VVLEDDLFGCFSYGMYQANQTKSKNDCRVTDLGFGLGDCEAR
jgi:hypothetical protein